MISRSSPAGLPFKVSDQGGGTIDYNELRLSAELRRIVHGDRDVLCSTGLRFGGPLVEHDSKEIRGIQATSLGDRKVHLHDVDRLTQLRQEFSRFAGPPGLFHVTRVRFDLSDAKEELGSGWEEFLGETIPFEFTIDEVQSGCLQQSAYFGARDKLDDYTGLAARVLGQFPSGTSPFESHHRNARLDRNQWTLALYRLSRRLEWDISIDFKGTGTYSALDLDGDDAFHVLRGVNDVDSLRQYMGSWKTSLEQRGVPQPRYIYAAIVTDLFGASACAIDMHLKDVEQGRYDSRPLVLPPKLIRAQRPEAPRPVTAREENQPDPGERQQERTAESEGHDKESWPPDEGWHFSSRRVRLRRPKRENQGLIVEAAPRAGASATTPDRSGPA